MPEIDSADIGEGIVLLQMAPLYYHSARAHLESAQDKFPPLEGVLSRIHDLDEKILEIEAKYENRLDA
jgi:hypothetical protein